MSGPSSVSSLHPEVEECLRQLAAERLGVPSVEISRLAGDASDRTYVRLHHPEGQLPTSVGMVHASPFDEKELPFLNVHAYFRAIGLAVPEIYAMVPESGVILIEDVGDRSLEDVWYKQGLQEARPYYLEAIHQLRRFLAESEAAPGGPHRLALSYGFDEALFMRELHMTRRYAFERLIRAEAPEAEFDSFFSTLAHRLCRTHYVLTHRDYHSRNLMAHGDSEKNRRLVILDFQDARLGPLTYDLASLVFDSYVSLPVPFRELLIDEFWGLLQMSELRKSVTTDRGAFDEALALTGLQRNLKAIGTFAFQKVERGNPRYLKHIPPTVANVRRHLGLLAEWNSFSRLLEPYLDALERNLDKESVQ